MGPRDAVCRTSAKLATVSKIAQGVGTLGKELSGGVLMDLYGVESRKGASPGPTGSRLFPFPAHQTGRVHFEHPAFRLVSPQHPRERSTPHGVVRRHRGFLASHCDTAGSKGHQCYAVL